MDFLEQVKNTAIDVAQAVAQKSTEVVELSKIKYAIFDLKADIKKLYTEVGHLVYREFEESSEYSSEVMEKCQVIKNKMAKIAALKAQAEAVKNGSEFYCPECGRECGEKDEVCPFCGSDIAVDVIADVPQDNENI